MRISDLYREIANNPKYKDITALRTVTKQLLNRARVRIQTIEGRGAKTSRYIATKQRLQDAGLLTAGGNVSLSLPKTDRNKILTVLRNITNFLDVADTTLKGQKRRKREQAAKAKRKKELEKKKREKERLKKKKEKQNKEKQKKEQEKKEQENKEQGKDDEGEKDDKSEISEIVEEVIDEITDDDEEEETEEDSPVIGDYWEIARNAGLFDSIPYDDFIEYVEDIFDNVDIADFERIVLDTVNEGASFWDEIGIV